MRAPLLLTGLLLATSAATVVAHTENAVAIAELGALIAEAPDQPLLYLRRAEYHEDEGDFPSAQADLRRALALAPDSLEVVIELGRVYLADHQLPAARAHLDDALRRDPRNPVALTLRARTLAALGEAEDAYADYTAAIATLSAPGPEPYLARAALAVEPARALAGLEEGIARLGGALTLEERALQLERQLGRTDAALRRVDAIAAQAERPELWLQRRGEILTAANRPREAREAYRAALAAFQRLPDWLRNTPPNATLAAELTRLSR